jgi:hypothetical protein
MGCFDCGFARPSQPGGSRHPGCKPSRGRKLLPDKGKLIARWGRKATGQAWRLMAGLPKEGARHALRSGEGGFRARRPLCEAKAA